MSYDLSNGVIACMGFNVAVLFKGEYCTIWCILHCPIADIIYLLNLQYDVPLMTVLGDSWASCLVIL